MMESKTLQRLDAALVILGKESPQCVGCNAAFIKHYIRAAIKEFCEMAGIKALVEVSYETYWDKKLDEALAAFGVDSK